MALTAKATDAARFGLDLIRVLMIVAQAESVRRTSGPRSAAEAMRRIGFVKRHRQASGRQRLQRAIRWVDRLFLGHRNCYRRALLEIALDGGAAREPLMLGFRVGGVPGSGHAWLGLEQPRGAYDAIVSV